MRNTLVQYDALINGSALAELIRVRASLAIISGIIIPA